MSKGSEVMGTVRLPVFAQQPPIPAMWQVNGSLPDRRSRELAGLGAGSRQVSGIPATILQTPDFRRERS